MKLTIRQHQKRQWQLVNQSPLIIDWVGSIESE